MMTFKQRASAIKIIMAACLAMTVCACQTPTFTSSPLKPNENLTYPQAPLSKSVFLKLMLCYQRQSETQRAYLKQSPPSWRKGTCV